MSSTRWISPALQGLLDELSRSPDSVLFGRGAGLAEAKQRRQPSSERAPERWSGREPGLLSAEREILRVHREEVGHLVRQISFGLSRRIPGLVERLDPVLDRAAQARALPRSSQAEARRALIDLSSPASPNHPVARLARLARAADLDLTDPQDAIALLRQAQRLAPHAMNLQHAGFWLGSTGEVIAARDAAIRAFELSSNAEQRLASQMTRGWVNFQLGAFVQAAEQYLQLFEQSGSVYMLATKWACELGAQVAASEQTAKLLLQELRASGLARGWYGSLQSPIALGFVEARATGSSSRQLLMALREDSH